ncbi:HAD family hydrolase [Sulfurospirillum deleyianum]|uniref:phosphoglycolate phosphatase n=1 Tax=Sulfurospirillum deleyianum (strain ATCC 51133 / DSM 6946 / 5175) TaxID=525898 RepID=D1B494_SULD5|nr:HAD family hydrolase [Sulfurospirillum deleyianum]ACZ12914.1 HAD-superfamily hydrolase, subfamily IA, variant 3 [Sulfurospirillum deleyianum DSM 6946]
MKTILFDLDGTLIDSTDAIVESFGVAYETFGRIVPEEEAIKKLIGHPLDVMFMRLGIASMEANDYVAAYKEHYRLISRQKTTLLPLAREAIEQASRIATLGIVTTKTARYSEELLEHMGVMHYFQVLIGRESVTYPKPHPEPIQKALQTLGKEASLAWMIGDTPMDLIAAKEAGVEGIGVLCGYSTHAELLAHTRYVVRDALDAVKLVAKIG